MLSISLTNLVLTFLAGRAILAAPQNQHWGPSQHQCSPQVVALATGIQINIVAQHGELNQTEALIALESALPINQTAIYEGIGGLIDDVQGGIHIREFYITIAPPGNAALPGLTKYAAAQLVELALAESLTGVPAHDLPILNSIKGDVVTGIQLNENNTAAAIEGCSLGFVFPPTY